MESKSDLHRYRQFEETKVLLTRTYDNSRQSLVVAVRLPRGFDESRRAKHEELATQI